MRVLQELGKKVAVIHSNRSQGQRQQALQGFKDRRYQILVATDIAARGIDVKDISHVINYDVPRHAEDYVHRIGRTGRAQAVGEAFTLVSPDEEEFLRGIERFIKKSLPRSVIPDFPYQAQPKMFPKPQPQQQPHHGHSQPQHRPHNPSSGHQRPHQGHGRPHGHGGQHKHKKKPFHWGRSPS
jgi:ATP-dependent RNA helicase RhlE